MRSKMKTELTVPTLDDQLTMETLEPVTTAIQNGDCKGYAQMNNLGEEVLCLWPSTQNVTTTTMRNRIWKWRAQYMNGKKNPPIRFANIYSDQSPTGTTCSNNWITPDISL